MEAVLDVKERNESDLTQLGAELAAISPNGEPAEQQVSQPPKEAYNQVQASESLELNTKPELDEEKEVSSEAEKKISLPKIMAESEAFQLHPQELKPAPEVNPKPIEKLRLPEINDPGFIFGRALKKSELIGILGVFKDNDLTESDTERKQTVSDIRGCIIDSLKIKTPKSKFNHDFSRSEELFQQVLRNFLDGNFQSSTLKKIGVASQLSQVLGSETQELLKGYSESPAIKHLLDLDNDGIHPRYNPNFLTPEFCQIIGPQKSRQILLGLVEGRRTWPKTDLENFVKDGLLTEEEFASFVYEKDDLDPFVLPRTLEYPQPPIEVAQKIIDNQDLRSHSKVIKKIIQSPQLHQENLRALVNELALRKSVDLAECLPDISRRLPDYDLKKILDFLTCYEDYAMTGISSQGYQTLLQYADQLEPNQMKRVIEELLYMQHLPVLSKNALGYEEHLSLAKKLITYKCSRLNWSDFLLHQDNALTDLPAFIDDPDGSVYKNLCDNNLPAIGINNLDQQELHDFLKNFDDQPLKTHLSIFDRQKDPYISAWVKPIDFYKGGQKVADFLNQFPAQQVKEALGQSINLYLATGLLKTQRPLSEKQALVDPEQLVSIFADHVEEFANKSIKKIEEYDYTQIVSGCLEAFRGHLNSSQLADCYKLLRGQCFEPLIYDHLPDLSAYLDQEDFADLQTEAINSFFSGGFGNSWLESCDSFWTKSEGSPPVVCLTPQKARSFSHLLAHSPLAEKYPDKIQFILDRLPQLCQLDNINDDDRYKLPSPMFFEGLMEEKQVYLSLLDLSKRVSDLPDEIKDKYSLESFQQFLDVVGDRSINEVTTQRLGEIIDALEKGPLAFKDYLDGDYEKLRSRGNIPADLTADQYKNWRKNQSMTLKIESSQQDKSALLDDIRVYLEGISSKIKVKDLQESGQNIDVLGRWLSLHDKIQKLELKSEESGQNQAHLDRLKSLKDQLDQVSQAEVFADLSDINKESVKNMWQALRTEKNDQRVFLNLDLLRQETVGDQDIARISRLLNRLSENDPMAQQLALDLEAYNRQSQSIKVSETTDFDDLFKVGQSPTSSCLNFNRGTMLEYLPGVFEPTTKMLKLTDEKGRYFGRMFIRLVVKNKETFIMPEVLYSSVRGPRRKLMEQSIREFLKTKSQSVGLETLTSLDSFEPFNKPQLMSPWFGVCHSDRLGVTTHYPSS